MSDDKCCSLLGTGQCGCDRDAVIVPREVWNAIMGDSGIAVGAVRNAIWERMLQSKPALANIPADQMNTVKPDALLTDHLYSRE